MNRIIYTFFKTLAVLFVLFIFLSISALAQSFTLHNIALLVVSVICLNKAFTRSEQQRISNIKAKAHKWYLVTGVPEKVRMSYDNYLLWQRLANFCAAI